jgi:phospho-N-acetylmuramoyl-pentapeptide-transferase
VIALVAAGGVALLVSLIGTPVLIRAFSARGIGKTIQEDLPQGHTTKAGTPTMGGIMIVAATLTGYVIGHGRAGAYFTVTGLITVLTIVGAGAVGAIDDWIQLRNERNLGLTARTKMAGLLIIAVGFAIAGQQVVHINTHLSFTRWDFTGFDLHVWGWSILAVGMILATTNAVNLTDGLDGLAAGSSVFCFGAFMVIGFWEFRHPGIYGLRSALDLALVASSMMGACAGFLWWNAAPARIIMGDTGALAIGAGLAAMALTLNVQMLLPIVGGLFVIETLSVMIQVATYRWLHRRVFRMAPLHHHFELLGWPETTVIVRFWILSGLATALALGIFYADFIRVGGVD